MIEDIGLWAKKKEAWRMNRNLIRVACVGGLCLKHQFGGTPLMEIPCHVAAPLLFAWGDAVMPGTSRASSLWMISKSLRSFDSYLGMCWHTHTMGPFSALALSVLIHQRIFSLQIYSIYLVWNTGYFVACVPSVFTIASWILDIMAVHDSSGLDVGSDQLCACAVSCSI